MLLLIFINLFIHNMKTSITLKLPFINSLDFHILSKVFISGGMTFTEIQRMLVEDEGLDYDEMVFNNSGKPVRKYRGKYVSFIKEVCDKYFYKNNIKVFRVLPEYAQIIVNAATKNSSLHISACTIDKSDLIKMLIINKDRQRLEKLHREQPESEQKIESLDITDLISKSKVILNNLVKLKERRRIIQAAIEEESNKFDENKKLIKNTLINQGIF